ncbi:MAG: hypothetical protein EZS28_055684, partial [Streblomastix strix]
DDKQSLPAQIALLQDQVQEILAKENINEAAQNKIGNFALMIVNGTNAIARKLLTDTEVIRGIQVSEEDLQQLIQLRIAYNKKLGVDKVPPVQLKKLFPELSKTQSAEANGSSPSSTIGPYSPDFVLITSPPRSSSSYSSSIYYYDA